MTTSDQNLAANHLHLSAILEGLAFVSKVFWGPEPVSCQAMHQSDGLDKPTELAFLSTIEPFSSTIKKISAAAGLFPDGEALFNDLESHYVSLFISNRQGIAAPLYHSCYTGSQGIDSQPLLMGAPAMEMKKRLASAGLALDENLHQLPDHLCVEIEYLYFLLREGQDGNHEDRLAEARDFAGKWMLPWVRQFQGRLVDVDKGGFYTFVAALLVDLLTFLGGRSGS